MVAKIAVSAAAFAIDKPYSYWVPEGMTLAPGQRVSVPFGRSNKRCEGIVLALEEGTEDGLKAVECCLDNQPVLSGTMLRLAGFMRERYFCTLYDAVRAMLPGGLNFQTTESYALTDDRSWQDKSIRQSNAAKLLTLLNDLGGQAAGQILRQAVPEEDAFAAAVQYLVRKKWLSSTVELTRRAADKTEQVASLASSVEEALEYASHRPKSAAMQKAVIELLCNLGSVSVKELCYFTGASAATVRRLRDLGYVKLEGREVLRYRQIQPAKIDTNLVLNPEQDAAYQGLCRQMNQSQPGAALLYGVTGSGKTAVYLKMIRRCLDAGKTAMLLVPEIALTPQLLGVMVAHFGENVAVLHSSLPATERYDQWKRVRSGKARVVVGTRSAVFAPCTPGLIILDEEQEHSYKSENSPRYHAREVALWRGAKEGALVLLGSATPSIETMYHAKQGNYRLFTLKQRYNQRALPQVQIVDMREELKEGNDLSFSLPLQEAVYKTAQAGKQTILLLNRRGNSRALVCVDCGKAPECPRCNARLTYHSANQRVMCHYCGFSRPAPERCDCGGRLKRLGIGTQKAQQELNALMPELEIARMDADTVSATNTHEMILRKFREENIPVLIGTQMVAKGLNFPNVTLVGVLNADQTLYSDDYRSFERGFSLMTQVVGRSGRGDKMGRAIIQTYTPENPIIYLAAEQDYDKFFESEIKIRKAMLYPPFADICLVGFVGQDSKETVDASKAFLSMLISLAKEKYDNMPLRVLGPSAAAVVKVNNKYRYKIIVKCRNDKRFREMLRTLLSQFSENRQFAKITVTIDTKPLYF